MLFITCSSSVTLSFIFPMYLGIFWDWSLTLPISFMLPSLASASFVGDWAGDSPPNSFRETPKLSPAFGDIPRLDRGLRPPALDAGLAGGLTFGLGPSNSVLKRFESSTFWMSSLVGPAIDVPSTFRSMMCRCALIIGSSSLAAANPSPALFDRSKATIEGCSCTISTRLGTHSDLKLVEAKLSLCRLGRVWHTSISTSKPWAVNIKSDRSKDSSSSWLHSSKRATLGSAGNFNDLQYPL
mmetsp:Transcript_13099/g.23960  ORF Transcript_13099/g.23960 Transcript_13099/m.23960 type:complete len:240 (+) Transcript_13099:2600-3319(+)